MILHREFYFKLEGFSWRNIPMIILIVSWLFYGFPFLCLIYFDNFWSGEHSLTWGGLRACQNLRRILVVYTYMYIRLIEIKIISVYTCKIMAREEERGNKCRFKIQTIQSILMLDSYFRTEDKKPWIWMKLWKFCMITNDFQDLETYSIHHDRLKFIGRKRTIFSTLLHD